MPLIRANRESVDDRFSVLGFTVRTESPLFEVGIATDPALFRIENQSQRSRRNFYSSRSSGAIRARRGEAAYLVPPDVLANFVGQSKLYFGLATYRENSGGVPDWVQAPTEGHMYVDVSGLTERGLRRLAGRPVANGAYGAPNGHDPSLDWGGDAQPQLQPQAPAKVAISGNGKAAAGTKTDTAPAPSAPYDDGFGAFPAPGASAGGIAPIVTRPATETSPVTGTPSPAATSPVAAAAQALAHRTVPRQAAPAKTLAANDFAWPSGMVEGNFVVNSFVEAYNARIADGFRGDPAPDPTQYSPASANGPDARAREEALRRQIPHIADKLLSDGDRQEVVQAILQLTTAVSLQVLDEIRGQLPRTLYQLTLAGDSAPEQSSSVALPRSLTYLSRRIGMFMAWIDVAIQKASTDTAERLHLQKQQWEMMLAGADAGATMFGFVPGAGEAAAIVGLVVHALIESQMPNFDRQYGSFDAAMQQIRRAYTALAAAVLKGLVANALGQKMLLDSAFIHPDVQAFLDAHEAYALLGWEEELSFLGYAPGGARAQSLGRIRALEAEDDANGIDGPIPDDEATAEAQQLRQSRALDTPAPEYPGASRFAPAHRSNYRAVTAPREISQIVIHITDGGSRITGTIGWFQNPDQRNARNQPIHVSAHYVVGRDGEVVQMVRNNDVAWHANSANSHSIGIEHVANTRGLVPTEDEYRGSAALVAWLCNQYGLPMDRTHVLGHAEADPHTTHTDCPNAVWDWDHYMDCVREAAAAAAPAATSQSLGRGGRVFASVQPRAMPGRQAVLRQPVVRARAMIIGPEDVEQAQRYAPRWADLFNWSVPDWIPGYLAGRDMSVQRIADAIGALNLDRYEVRIASVPAGYTDVSLLEYVRTHLNDFLDTDNSEFIAYTSGDDDVKWASASPVGTVFKIDIIGPDNAAVVASLIEDRRWRFTTIHTPWSGDHPVCGHREFGVRSDADGAVVVYTRGADRATDGLGESIAFFGADHLWKSFQRKLTDWVNANGGTASAPEPFSQRFHPSVVEILYGHGTVAQSLAAECYSIHWDTVPYYPQQSDNSCWAASAAMVVAWRDGITLSDADIAAKVPALDAYRTGLWPSDRHMLADVWNLVPEPPACYTVDAWRSMLESYGPLYLDMTNSAGSGGHAWVLTGMTSDGAADGSDTVMYLHNPTASRGRVKWNFQDFQGLYEGRVATEGSTLEYQILHAAAVPPGLRPVTAAPFSLGLATDIKPVARRPALRIAALARTPQRGRAQALGTETIEYPVQLVPQPNKLACWAASMAMLLSFRRNASYEPETLANEVGGSLMTSYSWDLLQAVRDRYGFVAIDVPSNTSLYFSPAQWAQWLRDFGPLWVVIVGMPHAVVVSGLRGNTDDAKGCEVKLLNPWDTRVNFDDDEIDFHPANAGYADWLSFQQFSSDFGNMAEADYGNWRVLHLPAQAATAQGLAAGSARRSGTASRAAGYLAPPPRRVSAFSLEDSAPIDEPIEPSRVPGTTMRRQRGSQGRTTWALDQLDGVKLPDPAAAMVPALVPTTVTLDQWPCVGADAVPLPLAVRFDAGGGAVGNVRITAGVAASLPYDVSVTATIEDEPQKVPGMGAPQAAVKVTIDVDFSGTPNGNVSARTRLRLVGNGRYDLDSAWV